MEIKVNPDFTLDELLDFLRSENEKSSENLRTREQWEEHLGMSRRQVLILLNRAKKRNILRVGRVPYERVDGVWTTVQGYAFDVVKAESGQDTPEQAS